MIGEKGLMTTMDELRASLRARVDACWERLEDAASELIELHEIPVEKIVDRIGLLAEDEDGG